MPPAEIFTLILPAVQRRARPLLGHAIRSSSTPSTSASCRSSLAGFPGAIADRRRLVIALLVGAVLFLLVAFAGHTPFYRLCYEFMPMLKKMRAMGMVFFLVAFPLALLAGIGLDRLQRTGCPARSCSASRGGFGVFALLGVVGVLQAVAEGTGRLQERMAPGPGQRAAPSGRRAPAAGCRVLAGAGCSGPSRQGSSGAVPWRPSCSWLVTAADLWSIDRQFYQFLAPAPPALRPGRGHHVPPEAAAAVSGARRPGELRRIRC